MGLLEKLPHLLNEAQRQAATHPGGPLLVVAGAGTGKTRVITYRVAYLAESGVAPWRILAITFTNKAAREMQERIWQEVNCPQVWVSTFHSFAARILRVEAGRLGFTSEFSIYDEDDALALIKELLKGFEHERGSAMLTPGQVRARISRLKNELPPPAGIPINTPSDQLLQSLYAKYREALLARNAMDFDDLLLNLLRLFNEHEDVRDKYAGRFLHLLVDEFQDTNLPQYLIAKHLASVHGNITVTGDPDQSIYSWRGARLENILNFENEFKGCRIVRLEKNYRSPACVVSAADALIKHNCRRLERSLSPLKPTGAKVEVIGFADDASEATGVVKRIAKMAAKGKRSLSDFAVLMRTNAQSQLFEEECLKEGLPYVIFGGTAFFQRREVKDAISYLRLITNPRDDTAFRRAVNMPPRGVGAKTLERLSLRAAEENRGLLDAAGPEFTVQLSAPAAAGIRQFGDLFKRLMHLPLSPVRDLVEALLKESGYLEYLKQASETERVENVRELVNVAARFDEENPQGTLREFLEMVALLSDQDRAKEADTKGRVLLMTLHAAKGLEFPVVFMVGLVEGRLPHERSVAEGGEAAIEEERRLCYVGMTRTLERLHLSYYRRQVGRTDYLVRSRFLDELPEEYLKGTGAAVPAVSWSPGSRRAVRLSSPWHSGAQENEGKPRGAKPRRGEPRRAKPLRVYECSEGGRAPINSLRKGDRVLHATFGVGRVVKIEGDRLVVDFARVGRKRLSARLAQLEKLG